MHYACQILRQFDLYGISHATRRPTLQHHCERFDPNLEESLPVGNSPPNVPRLWRQDHRDRQPSNGPMYSARTDFKNALMLLAHLSVFPETVSDRA